MKAPLPTGQRGFALGPLAVAIEVSAFEAWFARAQPAERIEYAAGPVLPRSAAVVAMAREWATAGLVTLTTAKGPRGHSFLAVRAGRAKATEPPACPMTADGESCDAVILRTLRRAANFGLACPTNAQLAQAAELPNADAARYRLRRLVDTGALSMEAGDNHVRRIRIRDAGVTGWSA